MGIHFSIFWIFLALPSLLAHDIQTTSHVRTAGCICLHTNGMAHVHPWDEQTWIKIQTFLPPEMYILRMYGIRTFCTFLVCTKELFLVCTNMYRASKCWFKLHLYLLGWFILHEYFLIRATFRIEVRYWGMHALRPDNQNKM
jgi:hypothetical protein